MRALVRLATLASVVHGLLSIAVAAERGTCPGGTFVAANGIVSAGGPTPVTERLQLSSGSASLDDVCTGAAVRLRGGARGTKVRITWTTCRGVTGPVTVRGVIGPNCAHLTGQARLNRTTRDFTAERLDSRAGGRILGTVVAELGRGDPDAVALVDAQVDARDPAGRSVQQGNTSLHGRYALTNLALGAYTVCASVPGFATHCVPASIGAEGGAEHHFRLRADGDLLRGQVQFADGSACRPPVTASVTLAGPIPRTVPVNALAEFALGIPAGGAVSLEARCGGHSATRNDTPSPAQRAGAEPYDLVVRNRPPQITALYIRNADGDAVRRALPGAKVTAVVEVSDPDGDLVHFTWRADGLKTKNSDVVAWRLLPVGAQNVLQVHVEDDGGAIAEETLTVDTSDTGDRFIGQVVDPAGSPIPGATITVDEVDTTSDGDGQFAVSVPEREPHVFAVRHASYATFAKRLPGPATELTVTLQPRTEETLDPTRAIAPRLSGGIGLTIPPNALVDQNGAPPVGSIRVSTTVHNVLDLAQLPGDGIGRSPDGTEETLLVVAALSVDLTDAGGRRFNLASGQTAHIVFPDRMMSLMDPAPATLTLYRFDEASGVWEARGNATRTAAGFEADLPSFSTWSVGNPTQFKGCVRGKVPDWVQLPFGLQVSIPKYLHNDPLADFPVAFKLVTQRLFAITGLPVGRGLTLVVSPLNSSTTIFQVPFGNVSTSVFSPPPYPYSACETVEIAPKLPASTDEWLSILDASTPPTVASANAYYEIIGAKNAKKTLAQWKAANGFGSSDGSVEAAFYNPNELGLGRRATCRSRPGSSGTEVACYVTKYGTVGSAPGAATDDAVHDWNAGDTVAMEYSPAPQTNGKRIVKFYIYKPNGQRSTKTHFDTSGTPRYVPDACAYCHGYTKDWHDDGDTGGHFNVFDAHAYRYSALAPLSFQQANLRQLNAMVKATHGTPDVYTELLDRLYPSGVTTPGATAVPEPPPPAWSAKTTLWNNYAKPLCRTCHMWQGYANFDTDLIGGPGQAKDPKPYICNGLMPHTQGPALRLWGQINPFGPDHFLALLGNSTGCQSHGSTVYAPDPPKVKITAPVPNVALCGPFFCVPAYRTPYDEFGGPTFTATATVQSSSTSCCSYQWTSTDGPLGSGATVQHTFGAPGPYIVTATATSETGQGSRSMAIDATNQPPTVTITQPAALATLYRNVTYTMNGVISDPNQVTPPPCSSLSWSITGGLSGFPKTGCNPTIVFPTNGSKTITLTGTDPYGLTASTTRTIQVIDAPPGSPPVVSIILPTPDQFLQGSQSSPLTGTATDPDGNQASISYQWTVTYNTTTVPIGTAPTLAWVPSSAVPFNCGGRPARITLTATDANGSGSDFRDVFIGFPPC